MYPHPLGVDLKCIIIIYTIQFSLILYRHDEEQELQTISNVFVVFFLCLVESGEIIHLVRRVGTWRKQCNSADTTIPPLTRVTISHINNCMVLSSQISFGTGRWGFKQRTPRSWNLKAPSLPLSYLTSSWSVNSLTIHFWIQLFGEEWIPLMPVVNINEGEKQKLQS